ncbi:iron transporter [Geodermatophilus sp. SYSU D00697]
MSARRVVNDRSTPAVRPPTSGSNEAQPEQLDTARQQGDAYGRALQAMAEEDGAAVTRAGHYLVALVTEQAEGMYAPDDSGRLVWREAPEEANTHIEVAVADGADGRFVPGLDVTVTVLDGERELLSQRAPFLWHPFLHHYGVNARVPGEGPYTVLVEIEPPTWMRHDPVNGRRFEAAVDAVFDDVTFERGRKPSPDARPRGPETPYAG